MRNANEDSPVTTQRTSKRIKKKIILWQLLTSIGIGWTVWAVIASGGMQDYERLKVKLIAPAVLLVISVVMLIATYFQKWWHHG